MRALLVLFLLAAPVAVASAEPRATDAKAAKADAKADAKKPADRKARRSPEPKAADAQGDGEPAAPPRAATAEDRRAIEILEKIVAGPDLAARRAAIAELDAIAPAAQVAIGTWVKRAHATDEAVRREVLAAIDADVPDKSGRFRAPGRQSGKERAADDDLDWMKGLLALDASLPGLGEVIADVAAIRALAATKDIEAAALVFDIAFGDDTMLYRDECGRYLRKMEPYSVPALTRASQGRDANRRRYATFQLERMDRQDPLKALAAASGDERLMVAVLDAFRATKLREAVHAVWTKVADDSPAVRAAARAAWMDYVTGPPPPPAPRKKLQLPGGKLTKKPKPLWLTYRELADNELRKAANDLLGEDYSLEDETTLDDKEVQRKAEKIDLLDVTKRLFAHFDGERAKRDAAQWAGAKAKADGGDLAAAIAILDRMIAADPERAERAEMAALYAAWGKQLEGQQQWAEASAAYSKAHGLDPKGAAATDRLAAHHFALGKALEAQGKDGGPDFRRAVALKPDYAPAQRAADRAADGSAGRPTWMLFAAIAAAIAALGLFGAALRRRRVA